MTPLLVATRGYIPCLSPLKIATRGFVGICGEVVDPPSSGGGGYRRPEYYGRTISFFGDTGSIKVEQLAEAVEETPASYVAEINRFQTAALQAAFQMQAAYSELEIYKERLDEIRYQLLQRDIDNVNKFIIGLYESIKILEKIKIRREEEVVLISILLANDL